MSTTGYKTVFGSIDNYQKGGIEIIKGDARHYVFSNVFEVASQSAPYEKVMVGANLEYAIEALRADGKSPWFACSHDEFVIVMDGDVRVDFIQLVTPPSPNKRGTVLAGENPKGRPMGYVLLKRGHQALLPAGCAYSFNTSKPGVIIVQTVKGDLSVEKWAEICLH